MIIKSLILIIIGFILLIKGADFLVDGSSAIAKKIHIPEIIVGLTIVSIGTSMPELFVNISSALKGIPDMALGNVIGSNLCNLLLILGISSVIKPIIFKKETKLYEIPMCIFTTILFLILLNINNTLSLTDGVILSFFFLLFLLYTIYMGITASSKEEKRKNYANINIPKNVFLIIIGIIALKYGGDFVVQNAEIIAQKLKISDKIIGLSIVAIGTSLPELITSITASIKGNQDIAIGNIIGSNIFNILFISGVTAIINPIPYNKSYNIQLIILLVSTIILALFPYTDKKDEMTTSNGITFIMIYFLYMVLLFFM